MKKCLYLNLLFIATFIHGSPQSAIHTTVAIIAENNLSPRAKTAVAQILNGRTLADVCNYPDEIQNDPEYSYTKRWHYINIPKNLDYNEFKNYVLQDATPNIYSNLLIDINYLKNPATIKIDASRLRDGEEHMLTWIVHLVCDAHQPMHVGRAGDDGGDNVKVYFNGRTTNLYKVWESGLIERQGLSAEQMTTAYDKADALQIKAWQSDAPLQWLWESYQINNKLYNEAEKNNKLEDTYYHENIPVIEQRTEMAGIRLAGLLNEIFKD
jgi:S1/P1 Nuclease